MTRLLPLLGLASLLVAPASSPVRAAPEYTPLVGQEGKDVVWVPTPELLVDRMLTMAQVGASDYVVDLGAGDGRTVIRAAQHYGARALGIEYNAELVALARRSVKEAGLSPSRAKVVRGDIFASDFRAATVVTLYLLPALNLKLRPTLLAMKPGTRVVSHQFTMDDWEPDETSYVEQRAAYLWIVPAQVAGGWRLALPDAPPLDLDLEQRFQKLKGRVDLGAVKAGLRDASLRGDEIRFALVDDRGALIELRGRVAGERMAGTYTAGAASGAWTATRRGP